MPNYKIILNPASGRGSGSRARPIVEQALKAAGVDYNLSMTEGPGQASQFAYEAAMSGHDIVVSVGGDGTAHEVIGGLARAAKERGDWQSGAPIGALGLVPLGTGNDFAWRLGLPLNDPDRACQVLLSGRSRLVDLGQVTDEAGHTQYFHNHLGGGFEAAAAIESLKVQRLGGVLLYLVAVFRVLPQYRKPVPMTVLYNGQSVTRPLLLVSASNGGRSGGGFQVAPGAVLDDGELDLVIGSSPNIPTTLWLLPHFLRGTHVKLTKYVTMARVLSLVVEAPGGIPVHLDGEIFRADARRLEIAVLPSRLRVIADPAPDGASVRLE
jgi:diacylglycerol kinase (ATP)